jgi:hypothetical protein
MPRLRAPLWPGAETEYDPTGRQHVERGDRRHRDGRVARREIAHTQRYARALARLRHQRSRDPGVHGVARRVGNADHVVTQALGALGNTPDEIGNEGPEQEPDAHYFLLSKAPMTPPLCYEIIGERGLIVVYISD